MMMQVVQSHRIIGRSVLEAELCSGSGVQA